MDERDPDASVVYRRPFKKLEELEVVFTCRDGRVVAESIISPYEMLSVDPETGNVRAPEFEEELPAAKGSLDVASFNALRKRIATEIEDGSCRPARRSRTVLGIGTNKWRVLCAYARSWLPVAEGLEAAIERGFEHVDPRDAPPPFPADHEHWPGDDWRDELGYYRGQEPRRQ